MSTIQQLTDEITRLREHILHTNGLLIIAAFHLKDDPNDSDWTKHVREECRAISVAGQKLLSPSVSQSETTTKRSKPEEEWVPEGCNYSLALPHGRLTVARDGEGWNWEFTFNGFNLTCGGTVNHDTVSDAKTAAEACTVSYPLDWHQAMDAVFSGRGVQCENNRSGTDNAHCVYLRLDDVFERELKSQAVRLEMSVSMYKAKWRVLDDREFAWWRSLDEARFARWEEEK